MALVVSGFTNRELVLAAKLKTDFEAYGRAALRIRAKDKRTVPLILNRPQQHVHGKLEEQLRATRKVRALILKGRQQGMSTYIAGRFYHRVTHETGTRVYVMAHEDAATQNLFEIVNRYHDNSADFVRPSTGAASAKELYFDKLDSGYKVGTAGSKATGRSSTIQLFHGSEVAFWPHADTHVAGVLQAVPETPGTEIILESTANGVGGYFHKMWRDAETGLGDFIAVFVPWFWSPEYARPVAPDFSLDDEERTYAELYTLSNEQMSWRRVKIGQLGDPALFKQEYPATAAEAFQMTGHDSFIPPALIAKARKHKTDPSGPLVMGYDPSWTGGDRSSLARRQGRRVLSVESRRGLDLMAQAGWLGQVIQKERPKRLFIDVGGVGAGLYDRLMEMGHGDIVRSVNFGSSPMEPEPLDENGKPKGGPLNRRAEMWMKTKEWLEDQAGAQIPDSDSLQADACGPGFTYDSHTRLKLEAKDRMRARGMASPDEWDAVALTFAEPVADNSRFHRRLEYPKYTVA
jgi:hypothetical protein